MLTKRKRACFRSVAVGSGQHVCSTHRRSWVHDPVELPQSMVYGHATLRNPDV